MAFRRRQNQMPGWLWIFLIAPLALIVLLLWRFRDQRFELARLRIRREIEGRKRYKEPDSIPIDTRRPPAGARETDEGSENGIRAEIGEDAEDVAQAKAAGQSSSFSGFEAQKTGWGSSETASGGLRESPDQPVVEGKPDELEVIEGIGPAIAGLLRDRGIKTFRRLAVTPVDDLRAILISARLQHLADPETWPEQARMAASGQWDELKVLQGTLKAGRRTNTE